MAEEVVDGRRLRGDRSRRTILEHAVRIASIEGLDGLTFGKVAAAADLPKSSVQASFADREALQAETLNFGVEVVAEALAEELAKAPTPLAKLRVMSEGWFDVVARKAMPGGCLLTAAADEYRARPGTIRDLVLKHRKRWRDALMSLASAAKHDGALSADIDSEQLVFEIMAMQTAGNIAVGLTDADFMLARKAVARLLQQATANKTAGVRRARRR